MKSNLTRVLIITIIPLMSCVELPDLNPSTNENVIVTDIMQTYVFDESTTFFQHLDINGNGTSDFYFYGQTSEDPIMGEMQVVILDGAYEYNNVIKRENTQYNACGSMVEFVPISELQSNFNVSWGTSWGEYAALYMQATPQEGCSIHKNFLNRRPDHYFGLKFTDEGDTYYGWIKIGMEDIEGNGYPGCGEHWIIKQCAFNTIPDTGLRIPTE